MDYFIGHLVGDFLLQNDWQAMDKKSMSIKGWLACLVHCLLYTAAVVVCTGWWEWYLIILVFLSHFPIDKTYILVRWMVDDKSVDNNHKVWAYLFVDQAAHLFLLWLIAKYVV